MASRVPVITKTRSLERSDGSTQDRELGEAGETVRDKAEGFFPGLNPEPDIEPN